MNILGYSERGAINSLMFEIAFSPDPKILLRRLLDRAMFLGCAPPREEIQMATALIEQSLSDFGDADAVLLLERVHLKSAVFVEGKVKSSQTKSWTLSDQFAAFEQGLASTLSSSNLFAQLYHKVRFAHAAAADALLQGVNFPQCSSKRVRHIGSNPVVRRAVEMMKPYVGNSYYLGIVPDSPQNVHTFVAETLAPFAHTALEHWDVSRWGFLCWSDVHDFCAAEGLTRTQRVLEFNQGQIC